MLEVGAKFEIQREVTQELVNQFAATVGDHNPIHVDPEFAAKTDFGRTIAHGMLIAGFFSSVMAHDIMGPGSVYLGQELKFKAPVFVGETVTLKFEVTHFKATRSICKVSTQCYDQTGKLLVDGEATALYRPKES